MKFERNTVIIGCLGTTVVVLGCALVATLSILLTGGRLPTIENVAENPPVATAALAPVVATEPPASVSTKPTEPPVSTEIPAPTEPPASTETPVSAEPPTPVPTDTPPAVATVAPPPADGGALKTGQMSFRYLGDALVGKGLSMQDFEIGTVVHVLPGQVISDEFLQSEVGNSDGKIYYGETGISFDPQNPQIVDKYFTVVETEPFLKFAEPFPENMRNSWNSYFQFDVELLAPGTR